MQLCEAFYIIVLRGNARDHVGRKSRSNKKLESFIIKDLVRTRSDDGVQMSKWNKMLANVSAIC